jgi:hypothetical protein
MMVVPSTLKLTKGRNKKAKEGGYAGGSTIENQEEIAALGAPPNAKVVGYSVNQPTAYSSYVEREKERHLKQIQPPPPQEPKPEKKKTNWWDIGMGALQVVGGAAEVIAGVTTAVFTAPSVGRALLGAYMAVDVFTT